MRITFVLYGYSHPAKIVRLACESTAESVEQLKNTGMAIIAQALNSQSQSLLPLTPQATVSTGFNLMER